MGEKRAVKKRSVKRLAPSLIGWSVEASVSDEMRRKINRLADHEFSDSDFAAMANAVAECEATWVARKNAPRRANVRKNLDEICEAAGRLRALLFPSLDEARGSGETEKGYEERKRKHFEAIDAARRALQVDGEEEEEDEAEVVARARSSTTAHAQFRSMLQIIHATSQQASASVAEMPTLTQGGDSTHWDRLLKDVFWILKRNGFRAGYSNFKDESDVLVADLAKVLVPLLSQEIYRPPLTKLKRRFRERYREWTREWDLEQERDR